jgi:hypothetical protein
MLCKAAAARARASLLPLVLPSNAESLSLPCRSWINNGMQMTTTTYNSKLHIKRNILEKQWFVDHF